jgi:hypothetical protein
MIMVGERHQSEVAIMFPKLRNTVITKEKMLAETYTVDEKHGGLVGNFKFANSRKLVFTPTPGSHLEPYTEIVLKGDFKNEAFKIYSKGTGKMTLIGNCDGTTGEVPTGFKGSHFGRVRLNAGPYNQVIIASALVILSLLNDYDKTERYILFNLANASHWIHQRCSTTKRTFSLSM